jgi:hypothetical protein
MKASGGCRAAARGGKTALLFEPPGEFGAVLSERLSGIYGPAPKRP